MFNHSLIVANTAQGLIFDCDGTLVDTIPLHYVAWQETFAQWGLSCPLEFMIEHNGKPTELVLAIYNEKFSKNIDILQFTQEKEQKVSFLLEMTKPLEVIASIVRIYYQRLPMAVVSGSNRRNVELALAAAGLLKMFSVILTADDGFPPKPHPNLFKEAAHRMRVEPTRCQVFEDADSGLEGAQQAGMMITDVRPFGGGWNALEKAHINYPSLKIIR